MLSLIWVSEFKKACEFFLFSADKKIWNLDKSANPNMSSLFVFTFLTFIHSSSHPYFLHPFILTSNPYILTPFHPHPFILPFSLTLSFFLSASPFHSSFQPLTLSFFQSFNISSFHSFILFNIIIIRYIFYLIKVLFHKFIQAFFHIIQFLKTALISTI